MCPANVIMPVILCACENFSEFLRGKMFEGRELERIFRLG
jgi:hypothetical protein